jgi:hypothetical protein
MRQFAEQLLLPMALGLGFLLAGCGATPIDVVDPALVGTWQGECAIDLPIVFDPAQLPGDEERTQSIVALTITIREDATINGTLGEAAIEASVLKRNRGELGRNLNVASDYIIIDGHLAGPIVSGADETDVKPFTIPFDLIDDHIQGGLMWRQAGKYPLPLCSVDLQQSP